MNHMNTKFVLAQKFVFDPNSNSLKDQNNDSDVIRLGSNESRILLMFSQHPNKIISRDELHEFVWRDQGFQVDDSSLTQAISTLRKMLGDSTKNPQFIKTVPKRGYQLIANVTPLEDKKEEIPSEKEAENSAPLQEDSLIKAELKSNQKKETEIENNHVITQRPPRLLAVKIMIIVALLLPVVVYLSIAPAQSGFKLLDTVDSIPVKTTEGHPPLGAWQKSVMRCIDVYLENHKDELKPEQIIVTTGSRDNIILNTVHSEQYSNENMTIQLIAKQQKLDEICR